MSILPSRKRVFLVLSTAVLGAGLMGGCASAGSADTPAPSAVQSTGSSALTVSSPWVKSVETGMTGAFGVFTNNGSEDIRVVAARTPAASSVELHQTVRQADGTDVMSEAPEGFTVLAGGEFLLEPGANHLMLMGLTAPVLAGDQVPLTLELSDGSTVDFGATAKDFSGANESYHGDDGAKH